MISNPLSTETNIRAGLFDQLKAVSLDIWIMLLMIAGLNLHLLGLPVGPWAVFFPGAVADGQWWRIIGHPFVHVSWYHLLLDAGAFFLLYNGLGDLRLRRRLLAFGLCSGASLVAAVWFEDQIEMIGLCGLSGAAHGLMALTGLRMIDSRSEAGTKQGVLGLASFFAVALKSIFEFIRGDVIFTFLHMGLCGTPLAASHLGGVIGGIVVFLMHYRVWKN